VIDIAYELARICDDARAHGQTMLDIAAIDRLLHRHNEALRRDLLSGSGIDIYPLA
jgi:hypothetical protein